MHFRSVQVADFVMPWPLSLNDVILHMQRIL